MGEQQPFIFHTVKATATIFSLGSRFDHLGGGLKSEFLNFGAIVGVQDGLRESSDSPGYRISGQICDSLVQREVSLPDMF